MSRNHAVIHLIGWLLFLVCAVLFLVSGVRAGDRLLVAGSVVFLLACLVFLVPIVPVLRRDSTGAAKSRRPR